MRELLDGADPGCHCLVDFSVIDHVLAKFCRRPGKDEHVMAFAGLDLGEGDLRLEKARHAIPVAAMRGVDAEASVDGV